MIAYLRRCPNLTIVCGTDVVFLQRFLHNGPDTVEELLDRHVVKEKSLEDEEESLNRQRLTSTRREALSLYRDILRATRFFMWPDSRGDPEVVTRLLIGGRDAVESALEKLAEKQRHQIQKERGDGR
ncbi:hypothetical protein Godav_024451 [Gossypium davidsonii]|uniref:Uncharacterized protein n=1 Tax=Gossypium davidsonii TaxID=34287 RepID=A0A7J8TIE2_GOSDV|nr:hypothetical protein [Gossypium davidsonii]